MRTLIADIYKIVFRVTGIKSVSFLFALAYVSTLNIIILYGITLLLEDWRPEMGEVVKVFSFPDNLLLALGMMFINFLVMLPLRYLLRDSTHHASIVKLLVYTFASVLVFLYAHYLF